MLNRRDRIPTEADPLLQERTAVIYSTSCSTAPGSDVDAADAIPTDPDADDSLQRLDDDVVQPSRKWIIEPIGLMFAAAMLSQLSVMTQYLYYRVGQQYNETVNSTRAFVCDRHSLANSSEHQLTSRIQNDASQWTLYRNVTAGIVALLVLPLYSSASDYLGRRLALLLPCAGLAVDSIGLLLVLLFNLPLYFLVISGALGALGGGFGALFAAMFAYLADTTSRKERPMRVAIVEGTFGLAGVIMELLIGWWMRLSGYVAPMVFSTVLTFGNLVYVVLLVPEVRPPGLQRKLPEMSGSNAFCYSLASPYINIAGLFHVSARLSVTLGLLLAAVCIYSCSFIGVTNVSGLYMMNYPFCLDSVFIGYMNALKIVCLQLGVLIGLLVFRHCFGVKPLGLSIIGLASAIVGFLATGVAPNTPTLLVASVLGLFSMLPMPMLRAFASQVSPPNRQGALFSCVAFLEVSGGLIGLTSFTLLYSATQSWLPGFVYLSVASCSLLALLLTIACRVVNYGCSFRRRSG